jgi:hypothetical protein
MMESLSRPMPRSGVASLLNAMIIADGTPAHPYCAAALSGDKQSFVRNLLDFADFVHLVSILHGQMPGMIDHAAARTAENGARGWLIDAIEAFGEERALLGKLVVAVGPLPSTAGHHEATTAIAQQRRALEMLAQSDRRGCALGAATTLVIEWQAIRALLSEGAARLGMDLPACKLPDPENTLMMIDSLPEPDRLTRAVQFGAAQLLGQHRGLWDLLSARAAIRREAY